MLDWKYLIRPRMRISIEKNKLVLYPSVGKKVKVLVSQDYWNGIDIVTITHVHAGSNVSKAVIKIKV